LKHSTLSLQAIILLSLAALFTQSGCKENTVINSRVSPSNNAIGVFSTSLPCITHTYYDDTVITSTNIGGIPIYQAVGNVADTFFGTLSGATYFQVLPDDFTPGIYDDAVVDSAVLVLPYSGFTYGDNASTDITQTYQVFYMTDTLGYYNTYYSYNSANIDVASPLSDPTTINVFHLKDSLGLNILPANYPGLRIKLKLPQLMNRIKPAIAIFSTSTNPTADWLNVFKGICVKASDSRQFAKAVPYFELDGSDLYSEAGIVVYCRLNSDPTTTIAKSYYYNTGSCAHINNITRSYAHYPVNNLLRSTAANDQVIALQNQPGASIDIVVPGIKGLPNGVINKAELRLTLLPGSQYNNFSVYSAPERLYPVGIGNGNYPVGITAGLSYNVADRYPLTSTTPLTVMDGTMHNLPSGSQYYTFTVDLPREVMSSIAAKNDTIHLRLNGTEDFYGAFHMVAGGGNYGINGTADTMYRAKLFVVYSKLTN